MYHKKTLETEYEERVKKLYQLECAFILLLQSIKVH
ncbi:MAG: hypothetical protein K0R16_1021 [Nitrososphaeraceae archaeon]|nr:hypothetical protein [Nitrososphaeraceae archaeon]